MLTGLLLADWNFKIIISQFINCSKKLLYIGFYLLLAKLTSNNYINRYKRHWSQNWIVFILITSLSKSCHFYAL